MRIYSYNITFAIEDNKLFYLLIKQTVGRRWVIHSEVIELSTDDEQTMFIQSVTHLLAIRSKLKGKCRYRMLLLSSLILEETLTLPNIELTENEKRLFIQSSVNKKFTKDTTLFFDYIDNKNESDDCIKVFICPSHFMIEWLAYFKHHNMVLEFVGINATNVHDIQERLAAIGLSNITQNINFLPWRKKAFIKKKRTMFLLLSVNLVFAGLLFVASLGYLQQQQNSQLIVNQQADLKQKDLEAYLAQIIRVNDENITQKKEINQYIEQLNFLSFLLAQLTQLSTIMSEFIWLESFDYQKSPQLFILQGKSFRYSDIMAFYYAINQQTNIENVQIESIHQVAHLLSFKMSIVFKPLAWQVL